jgi:hypothetical protein
LNISTRSDLGQRKRHMKIMERRNMYGSMKLPTMISYKCKFKVFTQTQGNHNCEKSSSMRCSGSRTSNDLDRGSVFFARQPL